MGWVQCEQGGDQMRSHPLLQNLSLAGKVDKNRSSHTCLRLDWGTTLLERGWTLFHSRVAQGESHLAGEVIHIAPRLGACRCGTPQWMGE